jgi:hypothetical protein
MWRDRFNFDGLIANVVRINAELEGDPKPHHRILALTTRLTLKNWLLARAMRMESLAHRKVHLRLVKTLGSRTSANRSNCRRPTARLKLVKP